MADEVEFTAAPSDTTDAPFVESAAVEAAPEPAEVVVAPVEAAAIEVAPEPVAPVAKIKPARKPAKVPVPAAAPVAVKPAAPVEPKLRKKPGRKPKGVVAPAPVPAKKPATRKISAASPALQAAAKPARRASNTVKIQTLGTGKPQLTQRKEFRMATPFDLSQFQNTFADLQGKAKAAYEKSTSALGEANEFAKGNVEAVVESGKILTAGLQDLGATLVTETRGAFEGLTADAKDLAAAKSPTEFFQLQGTIARKQFDGAVAQVSKSTEAWLKLANDVFAPLSGRVSMAVEKVSKAA